MNRDLNIKIQQTREFQYIDAGIQNFLASPSKQILRSFCCTLSIGLLIYGLFYSTMNTNDRVLMKATNHRILYFPATDQIRARPKLAIIMSISSDRINESVARVSVANKRNYVKRHGYEFILDTVIDATRSAVWSRMIILHSAMHSRPDIEWFWSLDLDAFILEKQIDIYDQVIKKYQWGLDKNENITKDILMSCDCTGTNSFNAGSFLVRNTLWSKQAMRTVYEKQFWERHYQNEEQDTMFWLYENRKDWQRQVQVFPMRLANSFAISCGEQNRTKYHEGDMVVHYAGYRQHLYTIWSDQLEKWRNMSKLVDDIEVDVLLK